MQIIKDLVPQNWQTDLHELLADASWAYQKGTSYKTGPGNFIQGMDVFLDENTIDTVQFVHYAMLNEHKSYLYGFVRCMMYNLENRLEKKITRIHRMKFNHQSPIPNFTNDNYNIPHSDDARADLYSMIYYVNDSDGDTFVFNEFYSPDYSVKKLTLLERITPEAGKCIVFPSSQFHASSNPITTPSRYVLNVTFEMED